MLIANPPNILKKSKSVKGHNAVSSYFIITYFIEKPLLSKLLMAAYKCALSSKIPKWQRLLGGVVVLNKNLYANRVSNIDISTEKSRIYILIFFHL